MPGRPVSPSWIVVSVTRLAARAAATLLCVFLVSFFLLQAMPGNPADRLDSPAVPAGQAERNRRALGLDRPLLTQLAMTLGSYARGDLGVSATRKRPVMEVLIESLPPTILLGSAALLLGYGVGLPLALLLLTFPLRWRQLVDRGLLVFVVIPRFWLGVMLIFLLHSLAGWFPATHTISPGGGGWSDRLRHLVLPALTLGLPAAFVVCRYQFVVMERVLGDLHVKMARAVGSGGYRLLVRHVLRPSMSPAAALFALDLPVLVSGAIVVEVLFAWPGVGRLTADAVLGADYPLALAAALLSGTVVLLGRLLAETLARWIDPRQAADAEPGRR